MEYIYKNIKVNINVQGEGSPILLLHGWGCSNEIFRDIQQVLSQNYTTYNFDFPGFGASDEPDTVWGTEDYTAMVEQFVKDKNISNPALVGHSFGGRISIIYASRNSVSRVVLVDAAGIKPKRPFKYYWKVYTFKALKWLCNTFLPKQTAKAVIDKRRKGSGSSDYNDACHTVKGGKRRSHSPIGKDKGPHPFVLGEYGHRYTIKRCQDYGTPHTRRRACGSTWYRTLLVH